MLNFVSVHGCRLLGLLKYVCLLNKLIVASGYVFSYIYKANEQYINK